MTNRFERLGNKRNSNRNQLEGSIHSITGEILQLGMRMSSGLQKVEATVFREVDFGVKLMGPDIYDHIDLCVYCHEPIPSHSPHPGTVSLGRISKNDHQLFDFVLSLPDPVTQKIKRLLGELKRFLEFKLNPCCDPMRNTPDIKWNELTLWYIRSTENREMGFDFCPWCTTKMPDISGEA